MRFGVCAGPEQAEILAEAGYDFIELSVAGHLMTEEDDHTWLHTIKAKLRALPLPPETFNSFVRVGKIVGPDVDFDALQRYVRTACFRASSIGGRIIVFGSGGARNIPEGFDPAQARQQLFKFLHLCDAEANSLGLTIAIEPLQKANPMFSILFLKARNWRANSIAALSAYWVILSIWNARTSRSPR